MNCMIHLLYSTILVSWGLHPVQVLISGLGPTDCAIIANVAKKVVWPDGASAKHCLIGYESHTLNFAPERPSDYSCFREGGFASPYTTHTVALQIKQEQEVNKSPVAAKPSIPAHFSNMFAGCGEKHAVSVRTYKNKRSPRRAFKNLTEFLNVLRVRRQSPVKSGITQPLDHVAKCLQQNKNTVTCFSGGEFYQFEGDLKSKVGERALKTKRFCSTCASSDKNRPLERVDDKTHRQHPSTHTHLLMKKSRFAPPHRPFTPYQEVMMEPKSGRGGPQRCYGFVAPQAAVIHSKRAKHTSTTKNQISLTGGTDLHDGLNARKTKPSNFRPKQRSGSRNQRSSLAHLIEKRSQIVSVACRPLYIPTAKPSVNDGRVPQCRVPCGAHNCGPVPTCPCRPPSRTPAPPLTTCPPIPGLAESAETLTLPSRCPAYEFTDEPCPTFECKDGCPYLTTPGCESVTSRPNKGGIKGQAVKEDGGKTSTEHSIGTGKALHYSSTVMASKDSVSTVSPVDPTTRISREENPLNVNSTGVPGSHSNVTGQPVLKSPGSSYTDSKSASKMPALWSNIDLKKLLKSAKSHYKEKVELNIRKYHNEA